LRFDEIQLPSELVSFLISKGYSELYPPQEEAIRAGLLNGKNLVISSPTASGKTLIAIMAAYLKIKRDGRKVVYLVPLRALASEKYAELKEMQRLGVKCAISTGDFDSSEESLGKYDILVLTNEKFDSILRHGVSWLDSVGLFVADEVHLVGSSDRGSTLEIILTKILQMGLEAQLLSLSATISNSREIASWLRSDLVEVNWRPVPLREGVYEYGRIIFIDEERSIAQSPYGAVIDVALDSVKNGGQSLIFAGTRRRAVSLATKASEAVIHFLNNEEKELCSEATRKIRSAGEETGLSRMLSASVEKGSAFHHAGLAYAHRKVVEDYYRMRAIKFLASTPTLAAGINLPARRVVVADLTRYDNEAGSNSTIPVLEYRQMSGRAGRPQYDEYGETIIVPPTTYNASEVLRHYTETESEPIESRLGSESSMRMHVLATIASGMNLSKGDIEALFSKTLMASQIGNEIVNERIDKALEYLLNEELISRNGNLLFATKFGKRVATLYIDPATGVLFKNSLNMIRSGKKQDIGVLYIITRAPDFEPKFPLREKHYELAYRFLEEHREELIVKPDPRSFLEYDEVLQNMRTVLTLHYWINEWREDTILERFGVEPGDLHRAIQSSDWLLYCLGELARLFGKHFLISEINVLRKRVVDGVKEELLELTSLEGIGRVRARSLHSSGFRTIESIREARIEKLASVDKIGLIIAKKIKEQAS
jgi:helicase